MNSWIRKIAVILGAAVLAVIAVSSFYKLYRAGNWVGEKNCRDLLYQAREGIVYRWTENGIVECEEDNWTTLTVRCDDQMESLKKLQVGYNYDGEHLIVSYTQDGNFQSMWKLGKGTHIIEIPNHASFLYIAVHKDEMSELILKNTQKIEAESRYKGRYLSVLGDSISSYEGYIPRGFYPEYTEDSGMTVKDMWWYQTALRLGMNICRINGSSGSGVLTAADGTGGNDERCVNLHTKVHAPDLILVLLGANDFFRGSSKEKFRIEYREMIERMQACYPDAEIVLCTYYHPSSVSVEVDMTNEVIGSIGNEFGLRVISLEKSGIEEREPSEVYYDYKPEIKTGVHPNAEGQKLLSDYVCQSLEEGK